MTTTSTDSGIHSRAVLVWLQINGWTARKYDRAASEKVLRDYSATDSDAARVNKALIQGDATTYKTLTQLTSAIRAHHYAQTLAWADEGWRLLPTANYLNYTTWYRQVNAAFGHARDAFVADYPALRDAAPARLNGLYRAEDYPTTQDVLSRFRLSVEFSPVPSAGDIRVDLSADQITAIETSITDRVSTATETAMHDAWTRLHDVVAHIAERLSDPKAVFRDSLITNAREVCDVLSRLNVTNDPQLEAMRARVSAELTQTNPDDLRDSARTRATVASQAQDIIAAMSGLYSPATR